MYQLPDAHRYIFLVTQRKYETIQIQCGGKNLLNRKVSQYTVLAQYGEGGRLAYW